MEKTWDRWVNAWIKLAGLTLVVTLTACGGGGDDEAVAAATAQQTDPSASTAAAAAATTTTTTNTNTTTTPPPSSSTTTTVVQSPTATSSAKRCGYNNLAQAIVARVNAERARGAQCGTHGSFAPAAALVWSDKLETAALGHSADMMQNNFFSHTSADGRTLVQRVNATGYQWSRLGENIAASFDGVDAVVSAWMASDGHCANIMNPAYRDMGVACVVGTASNGFYNYWTQEFGTAP